MILPTTTSHLLFSRCYDQLSRPIAASVTAPGNLCRADLSHPKEKAAKMVAPAVPEYELPRVQNDCFAENGLTDFTQAHGGDPS